MVTPLTIISKDLGELLAEFRASIEAVQQPGQHQQQEIAALRGISQKDNQAQAVGMEQHVKADTAPILDSDDTLQHLQGR